MPEGLDPGTVAQRIVDAIVAGDREIPASAFSCADSAVLTGRAPPGVLGRPAANIGPPRNPE